MSTSRLLSMFVAVVLVVMAIVAVRAGNATSAVVSSSQDLSDYFQRHPGASVAAARADLSDYFLRHLASAVPAGSVASDWFERHHESMKAGNAVDQSDYYQRHSNGWPTIGVTDPVVLKDLAAVRQATAKYHDVNLAIADGYLPTTQCDAIPGTGGMGYHYVNPARAMDPAIDLAAPEILMYASVDGQLRLVGVEYFYAIGAPDAPIPNPAPPAPILFGRPFDGPMLGHILGMPPHYDLHAWVWQPNPDGIFAMWNPRVTCP